jgi:hypothetical protein
MSYSWGFVFWGPEGEFKEFAKTLPSLNRSVTVDVKGFAPEGGQAHFFYNKEKFFLCRGDDSVKKPWNLLRVHAVIILVNSSDTKYTVKARLEQMETKFGSIPIAIYSEKPVTIEGLDGVLDKNKQNFLTSSPAEMENNKKEVSGEYVI